MNGSRKCARTGHFSMQVDRVQFLNTGMRKDSPGGRCFLARRVLVCHVPFCMNFERPPA